MPRTRYLCWPGEEIAFVPPAGSESGTWTLCGVVAAPEPEPEAAATRLDLKPAPELASLSKEQALGLAIAGQVAGAIMAGSAAGADSAGRRRSPHSPTPTPPAATPAARSSTAA